MKSKQESLLSILPPALRRELNGSVLDCTQEIHLRLGRPPMVQTSRGRRLLPGTVSQEDLRSCVNLASRYSPWNSTTAAWGYLTAPGGHRIGLCGETAASGIRTLTSLCIRVSRELPGLADQIPLGGNLLILGPPGWGKTTLLRDLVRRISRTTETTVAVVDERCEIFPLAEGKPAYDSGPNTDVLLGKSKAEGISMVLRSMGPEWIAVDEITDRADCEALAQAAWCGVGLLATAHAGSVEDFRTRRVYAPLSEAGIFQTAVVLHPDKSYHAERMTK